MCCISPSRLQQALELLAGEIEPHLIVIVSDIDMPGMDGLTLLREIKQRRPDLPVMMMTAYGRRTATPRCRIWRCPSSSRSQSISIS